MLYNIILHYTIVQKLAKTLRAPRRRNVLSFGDANNDNDDNHVDNANNVNTNDNTNNANTSSNNYNATTTTNNDDNSKHNEVHTIDEEKHNDPETWRGEETCCPSATARTSARRAFRGLLLLLLLLRLLLLLLSLLLILA